MFILFWTFFRELSFCSFVISACWARLFLLKNIQKSFKKSSKKMKIDSARNPQIVGGGPFRFAIWCLEVSLRARLIAQSLDPQNDFPEFVDHHPTAGFRRGGFSGSREPLSVQKCIIFLRKHQKPSKINWFWLKLM